jgi:prepilin-type N-terminal cleavage/methylation domain-containing protein
MKRAYRQLGGAGEERGMTLIEVVVAALVLAMAAMATFALLASATKNAQRGRQTQVALDLAQEEIERLRGVPYDELAISKAPSPSGSKQSPDFRVQSGNFALKRSPVGEYAPLVVHEGMGFSPRSDFVSGNPSSGGISGTIYRYVVWRNDSSCPESQCPGEQDYKQVVVAVQPTNLAGEGERGYVEVQGKRIDPEALNEPPPSGEEGEEGETSTATAQQFYLSDTPCAATGTTTRQTIAADHLLHNTLGTCASGLQSGNTIGAPDTLLLAGPPDPDPENDLVPSFYDYSDDPYLEPTPDTDKGLQIRHDDSEGCNYDPTGTSNPESQVHRWVSDPMAKAFVMNGAVTLEFYTRTLNDAIYTGRLCIYLFDRSESGGEKPVAKDVFLKDKDGTPYWIYEPGDGVGFWPRNMWTKIRRKMELAEVPYVIQPGHRLGVAFSVDIANTTGDALAIMYDHPNYPTRLEVETTASSLGG